jgi:hypothetical protein
MSIAGLVFFIVALGVTGALIAAPLLRRDQGQTADEIHIQKQRERLLVYYERVLTNLRDLDEDHATGKMPDDAYALERDEWQARGIQVLRAMDSLENESMIPAEIRDEAAVDEAIDDAIEAAIAAHR